MSLIVLLESTSFRNMGMVYEHKTRLSHGDLLLFLPWWSGRDPMSLWPPFSTTYPCLATVCKCHKCHNCHCECQYLCQCQYKCHKCYKPRQYGPLVSIWIVSAITKQNVIYFTMISTWLRFLNICLSYMISDQITFSQLHNSFVTAHHPI